MAANTDRTQRILVPLDGSEVGEQVIPHARALAHDGSDLVFLRVVPEAEPVRGLHGKDVVSAEELLKLQEDNARLELTDAATRWAGVLGSSPEIEVVAGDPAAQILEVAASSGATMIAMTGHGHGLISRMVIGSVADRVARSSSMPVMILTARDDDEFEEAAATVSRFVVPLDGSELAAEALPVAAQLASQTGAPVHLVHVITPSSMIVPTPLGPVAYPGEIYQEVVNEMTDSGHAMLNDAKAELAKNGDVNVTTAVLDGPVVAAIESVLVPTDVIVMTTHGRTGFQRWLLGSVAEKLMKSGKVPVVLVPSSERVAATESGTPS